MLKNFCCLLQAHSEAQPYYPLEVPTAMSTGGATEQVGYRWHNMAHF